MSAARCPSGGEQRQRTQRLGAATMLLSALALLVLTPSTVMAQVPTHDPRGPFPSVHRYLHESVVVFAPGSAVLDDAGRDIIRTHAAYILKHGLSAVLDGYADDAGDRQRNKQ